MRTRCFIKLGDLLLLLAISGFLCMLTGCDAGGSEMVPRVVETPEQVLRRDRAIRDAVKKGAYGKYAQRAALRRSRR